jgi:hypothetical protein
VGVIVLAINGLLSLRVATRISHRNGTRLSSEKKPLSGTWQHVSLQAVFGIFGLRP